MKNIKNALSKPAGGAAMPWALWIWNGPVDAPEVERRVNELISKGFGGIAVRPGRDMRPSYMSQEFLDNFGIVLEAARQRKVGVRLADDFSLIWSGCLNGTIGHSRRLRAEYLAFEREVAPSSGELDVEVAIDPEFEYIAQALKKAGKTLSTADVRQVAVPAGKSAFRWKAAGPEWRLLLYRREPVRSPSGRGVPNVLNQKTVFGYIQSTLEVIKSEFSRYVPTTFEGFITEMPALRPGGNAIYWDDDIAVKYKSRYKREFMPMLPALFLDLPGAERARTQAHSFIFNLMAERFAAVLDGWAKKYRLSQWVLWPEAGVYRPENALCDGFVPPEPAIPSLGLQNLDGGLENFALLRAAADVNTNQYRRETLTVVGRNRTGAGNAMLDLKREIDLSLLAGPSRVIIDGIYFNTDQRNTCKVPFNPSWYSPEWEHFGLLCGYSARAQEMIAGLHASREVAVLSPSGAVMGDYAPGNAAAAAAGLARFHKAVDALCCFGKGFDVVTEELLLSCMVRQNGEFATADRIRKGNYQALVVPYAPFVTRSLLVFFEKLAVKGTTLVFVDEPPVGTYEDGATASIASRVQKLVAPRRENVSVVATADLDQALVNIKPEAGLMRESGEPCDVGVQVYHGEGGRLYLFHNVLDNMEQTIVADVQAEKYFASIDCATGALTEIEPVEIERNIARLRLTLSPLQTAFIVSGAAPVGKAEEGGFNPHALPPRSYRIIFKDQWDFEPLSANALPLSSWSVRIGMSRESGQVSHFYETSFEAKDAPAGGVIVMNGMSRSDAPFQGAEVTFNGVRVDGGDDSAPAHASRRAPSPPPSVDAVARIFGGAPVFNVSGKLVKGMNRLSIRTTGSAVDPQTLVYPPLVVGEFSVAKGAHGFAIDKAAQIAGHDSWAKCGYPYMSGRARYSQMFEVPNDYDKLVLRFSKVSGTVYVKINDIDVGVLHWPPMEIDITRYCDVQRNRLTVEVVNTIDNVLRINGRPSGLTGEVYIDVYKAQ